MQSSLRCKINFPKVSTLTYTLTGNSSEMPQIINNISVDINPVSVDGKVTFNREAMVKNQFYPYSYQGKDYLVVKSSENAIDIYRMKK